MKMNQNELNEILRKHKMWLNDEDGGERADLSGADLSGADLSRANLSGANLRCADISGANLSGADISGANLRCADISGANLRCADLRCADISGANLRCADISGANLSGADLSRADLSGADISGADLSRADISGANLRCANLRCADLRCADLSGANLSHADISGATGLVPQWEFIKENFEATADGIIAYKTFNSCRKSPENWKIEKGSVITENVNFNRTNECGCGINVAPIKYVKKFFNGEIWKVLIRWEWLAGVCVPYNSDGEIRCECVELLEIVKE